MLGVIETMDDCCIDKTCVIDRLRERQTATLRVVLPVNTAMFVVELVSGLLAGSVALLAAFLIAATYKAPNAYLIGVFFAVA
jgi:Co/Zn/Cd efflux system component